MSSVLRIVRASARASAGLRARTWPSYSRLFLLGDGASWVISREIAEVSAVAQRLGARVPPPVFLAGARRQAVFHGDQFSLVYGGWPRDEHRFGVAYFHGRPGTPGMPEFDECYRRLCETHERIDRVQASHRAMRDVILESGIESDKVFVIPIGVSLDVFRLPTSAEREESRRKLGLPASAFVVGSLQKDGVGWEEGTEPKLIKGPDVLLDALGRVAARVPDLHVLLSGPARGYVKLGLERLGIPYVHVAPDDYAAIGRLFWALDACLISSRQEGGPKALLESMASGVPVVTTRVGQSADLVVDGENAFMVEVEDAEGLADRIAQLASAPGEEIARLVAKGRATAEANSYPAQAPLWKRFLDGFVTLG